MKNKSFGNMQCPIARSLEHVGEWWSILILREALKGFTRFDDFQKNLDVATSTLTKRLAGLVESGLLERKRYSDKPPRYEYTLTAKGQDFRPVMIALMAWGNKHFADEGLSIMLVDKLTGEMADVALLDKKSGKEITALSHHTVLGPAANDELKQHFQLIYKKQQKLDE